MSRTIQKEETYQRLLEKAAQIFAKIGYAQANINEISVAAGFGKGTIYNYFKNKKDLLAAIIRHACHGAIQDILKQLENLTDPVEKIHTLIRAEIEWFKKNEDLGRVMIREGYGAPPQDQKDFLEALQEGYLLMTGIFQEGIEKRCFRKDADPQFATHMLFGIIETQLLSHWLLGDQYPSLDKISENIFSIFMFGLKEGGSP
ncbi:MAG: hypothetical protein A3F89_04380 [Deltaproteobacteria bacterium RIFCSPLOWO2_12_FULL_50_11]|nr:MAG: hypothetical protein A3F89_04380 [Deltaproteobacteria bacterium RIFCSPLOWO2_12_FULL_50_11]